MSFRAANVRGFAKMRGACALTLAVGAFAMPLQHAVAQNNSPALAVPQVTPPPTSPVIPSPTPGTITGPTGSAVVNLIRLWWNKEF